MASGFNNSFEKSFGQGMAVGSEAAMETIKEKIKANDDARKTGVIIDALRANIIKSAKSPEEAAGFDKALDGLLKAKLSSSETIQIAKAIAPNAFSSQSVMMPGIIFDPETGSYTDAMGNEVTQISKGQTVRNKSISPEFAAEKAGATASARADVSASQPTAVQKQQAMSITTQIQNFDDAMKLLNSSPQGVVSGNLAKISGVITGGKENTAGKLYNDIRPALSSAVYKDMTGDTRLSDQDAQTRAYPLFPKQGDDPKLNKLKENFIRQSLEKRRQRYASGDFSPISQSQIMDEFVNYVASSGKSKFKPGDEQTKNGVTYVRQEDGKWLPKKK